MNPSLVETIRARMQAQSTEQLLDLWVTNDRATWSQEAFEAAKSILAERGVTDLPAQKDPAPIARRRVLSDDAGVAYWLDWFRPFLWIAIALPILELSEQAIGLAEYVEAVSGRPLFRFPDRVTWGLVVTLVLPAWLLVSAIGCLRLKARARTMLLAWAWVTLALCGYGIVYGMWRELMYRSGSDRFLATDFRISVSYARAAVLPLVLIFMFRRPEIRAVFARSKAAGFEPSIVRGGHSTAALADSGKDVKSVTD